MASKESNQFVDNLLRGRGAPSGPANDPEFQAMWMELQESLESVMEQAEQLMHSVEALPQNEAKLRATRRSPLVANSKF